eukprot:9779982-Alexandrium_andersonii.AAC.1
MACDWVHKPKGAISWVELYVAFSLKGFTLDAIRDNMHVGQAVRIFRQDVQNIVKQHTHTSCHQLFATGITAPRLVHLGFCTAVAVICAEPQWTQG